LTTKHYWKSGSRVPDIPHRGYQLIQTIIRNDKIDGVAIDRNLTKNDNFRRFRAVAVRESIGSRVNSRWTAAASLQWVVKTGSGRT
jgi:hypothetical protein